LFKVKIIYSNWQNFAALTIYGDVICWPGKIRKCYAEEPIPMEIKEKAINVQSLKTSNLAFAALTKNGEVYAWGVPAFGGKIPFHELQNVKEIFSNDRAFIALKNNGKIIGWGSEQYGATIPASIKFEKIDTITSTEAGFVAFLKNGKIHPWGKTSKTEKDLELENKILTNLEKTPL
jgi:hypothetical protein